MHFLEHVPAWVDVLAVVILPGRYILVGLTVSIVSDIIHTAPGLDLGDLLFLALMVAVLAAVRHFLSREALQIKENPAL